MLSIAYLRRVLLVLLFAVGLCATGCIHHHAIRPADETVPNEATKVSQPTYIINPPDVLVINAAGLVPRPPYLIGAIDVLSINVTQGPKQLPLIDNEPINGLFSVSPEGTVNLGLPYGSVSVSGLTLEQAHKAIEKHLLVRFKGPLNVSADLAQSNSAIQQIRGEHLVRPDGTVGLGMYGGVYVDGKTIEEAKAAIEEHLSQFLLNPKISLDVAGFNSKVYYVITDLAGAGQRVFRLPIMGKETVLDGISQVYGLTPVSSKRIWVARPGLSPHEHDSTLPVDWNGITQCGQTATNYQLTAGDRIYVMGAPLVTFDTYLGRLLSPLERMFGITLLGNGTVRSFRVNNGGGLTSGF